MITGDAIAGMQGRGDDPEGSGFSARVYISGFFAGRTHDSNCAVVRNGDSAAGANARGRGRTEFLLLVQICECETGRCYGEGQQHCRPAE
jgi:hypothetical protein